MQLGYFGLPELQGKTIKKFESKVGSKYFKSPEFYTKQPEGFKTDIWGFGCVMYHLKNLEKPFDGKQILDLACNIVKRQKLP